ncbi:MAG: hypothetical protein C4B59_02905 [Candidatus Methanogaster sp.]|uniref:Uncharacterized protein n=1 Tax=Candidatus Methanogaster sp. TaxID=3386292 RepID=A0AC61L628_9EURY|nr:MAG: hypothetical protein C4B59_02905 [ANME-2 cluster archaeon]
MLFLHDSPRWVLKTEHNEKIILEMPRYQEIVPDLLFPILFESPGKFRITGLMKASLRLIVDDRQWL